MITTLIIGIILIIISIMGFYQVLEELNDFGFDSKIPPTIFSVIFLAMGILLLVVFGYHDCKEHTTPITTVKVETVETPTTTKSSETIYYIISSVDSDGVWVGDNMKILGHTDHVIGDTIIWVP